MKHRGFTYHCQLKRNGVVVDAWEAENLIPTEGLEYMLGVSLLSSVAKISNWYVGLFAGSYAPTVAATAATLQSLVTEETNYGDTNRPSYAPTSVTGGTASHAHELTFTAAGTLNGAFISSSAAKSGSDGTLISIARFATERTFAVGDTLTVTGTVEL